MKYVRENRFWTITGLETFILGMFFGLNNNFVGQPLHMPVFVKVVDDPPFAIVLMIVGFYVTLISMSKHFTEANKAVVTFVLLFIWTFYFIIFLLHDIVGPFTIPRYTTIITGFIVFRVMVEAVWGVSH